MSEWLEVGKTANTAKERRVALRLYKSGKATCFNFNLDPEKKYYLEIKPDYSACRLIENDTFGRTPACDKQKHHLLNIFQLKALPETMTFLFNPETMEGWRV